MATLSFLVSGMSLSDCRYIGTRLPDTMTCGRLCDSFPDCLPSPSVELVAEIRRVRLEAQHDAHGARDTAESLNLLHQALVAGLEGKHGPGD